MLKLLNLSQILSNPQSLKDLNQDELRSSLGEFPLTEYIMVSIAMILDKPAKHQALTLNKLGRALEKKGNKYEAALCYSLASLTGSEEAYRNLVSLGTDSEKAYNTARDERAEIPLALCQQRLQAFDALRAKADPDLLNTFESYLYYQNEIQREMILSEKLKCIYQLYLLSENLRKVTLDTPQFPAEIKTAIHENAEKSFAFLEKVFSSRDQALIAERMADLIHYANQNNPGFIPGQTPVDIRSKHQKEESPGRHRFLKAVELIIAEKKSKVLLVNDHSLKEDVDYKTLFYSELERNKLRVIIDRGVVLSLVKNTWHPVDTASYESHKRKGFAAFTINTQGEISLFSHFGMVDQIAHSSANEQKALFAAGELKINEGKIVGLTAHSGHYRPTLLNVYHTLSFFKEKGVDLDHVSVYLKNPLPSWMAKTPPVINPNTKLYEYKATNIFQKKFLILLQAEDAKDRKDEKIVLAREKYTPEKIAERNKQKNVGLEKQGLFGKTGSLAEREKNWMKSKDLFQLLQGASDFLPVFFSKGLDDYIIRLAEARRNLSQESDDVLYQSLVETYLYDKLISFCELGIDNLKPASPASTRVATPTASMPNSESEVSLDSVNSDAGSLVQFLSKMKEGLDPTQGLQHFFQEIIKLENFINAEDKKPQDVAYKTQLEQISTILYFGGSDIDSSSRMDDSKGFKI